MRDLGFSLLVLGVIATAQPILAEPASGALETIEQIAPGVWSIHQRQPFHLQPTGNVEVIEQRKGLVVIDSGSSAGSARRIAQLIRSVSAKPVIAIAITHWHNDHSLGAGAMLEAWPNAEVIATTTTRSHILGETMERYPQGAPDDAKLKIYLNAIAPTQDSMRKRAADPALPASVQEGYASTVEDLALYGNDLKGSFLPTKIDGFEAERLLDDPVRPVQLRFLGPGNTDGDLVAWLPKQRILAAGDLVTAPIPFGFDSYPASWQSDLDKLIGLHARTIVPGHGRPMHDSTYLKALRDMLADLRAKMAKIGPSEDLDQATKDLAPAFAIYEGQFTKDDAWLKVWFVAFWQNPISEALWKESRGIPIEQSKA